VTRGIVSALRDVQGVSLVQTDTAINPGNSGGPLLDRYGRVVGINTWKIAGSAQSLGFAVSTYYARAMLGPEFAPKADRSYETGLREYTENLRVLAGRGGSR
jgi:serine protease Do